MPYTLTINGVSYDATLVGGSLAVNGGVIAIGVTLPYPGLVWEDDPPADPPPPPVPGTIPPRLVASAFGVTPLPNEYDIALEGPFNLIGAMYLDVGFYYLLFTNAQSDTGYFVIPSDGATRIAAVEKGTNYILLEATTQDGVPVDPSYFNVQIYRL